MRRRSAFTLVELLVTMALVLFIMAILSEAFVVGLETFRNLKAVGDMNERLRAATSQFRADLQADHFEGKRRLGDPNFWAAGAPREGFIRIYAPTNPLNFAPGQAPSYTEGVDGDGIPSVVATDMVLHLSVKQRANRQERFFTANIVAGSPLLPPPPPSTSTTPPLASTLDPSLDPADARYESPNQDVSQQPWGGGSYSSPWSEVAYFLVRNGDAAGSTPLYTLYRAQYVVTPDNSQLNWPANNPPFPDTSNPPFPIGYSELSCESITNNSGMRQIYFNSPTDLAGNMFANPQVPPQRVLGYQQPPIPSVDLNPNLPANSLRGATFVLGDVISFEIKALLTPAPPNPTPPPQTKPLDFYYVTEIAPTYDTALGGFLASPGTYTIPAIQITLRVWDKRTLQTRQVTIVQDM